MFVWKEARESSLVKHSVGILCLGLEPRSAVWKAQMHPQDMVALIGIFVSGYFSSIQCDKIGRFFKVLVHKVSFKSSPNIFGQAWAISKNKTL